MDAEGGFIWCEVEEQHPQKRTAVESEETRDNVMERAFLWALQ